MKTNDEETNTFFLSIFPFNRDHGYIKSVISFNFHQLVITNLVGLIIHQIKSLVGLIY